ncbi:hypothetical protein VN12_13140 [Pirellula sp. SH-Sr6A]|uniref:hypothetical protein n=1 Tax=Pirellula sp. SH-Sr6A TaxID=1632865 RepID=UPI00078B4AAB|nr:hypothetical protein [Pirellula sp. SH-Sr6A]AMV33063.1 hypothetical protein VN12_13140 [Pirellula sp. SH-Sr6A]
MNTHLFETFVTRKARWLPCLFVLWIGCGGEKESLHELEHEIPAHWPADFQDAISKIEQRTEALKSTHRGTETRSELVEIVGWVPEIAGDTDLPEELWVPIYRTCETLRRHLEKSDVEIVAYQDDFDRLATLLRESDVELRKIKKQLDAPEPSPASD